MAIFKCKMCGGTLEIPEGTAVAECEYCGSKQTVPLGNDEVVTNLFNRANNLRLKSEFDKAAEIYGKILNTDDKISEAHWGLVLCKYGIEYVEDPKTYRRIPTCHRTQYVSVLSDADYLAAIENADAVSRELYIAQAHEIAELQRSILAIVKDEKPFDVFICYKETDENGRRTLDSTLANDIYYQLTREGLRVFYSAITLENKLGIEYEPYIFAALNSARVMLVIGTKPEYFTSVWMKNEWSRYLGIMKNNREKLLIPCYRDMDAYDLPEEFAHLQAQDMSKIGFINDLVRGIKKVTAKDEPKVEAVIKETVINEGTGNTVPLLKRAFMFLEDGEWESADEYAEKVLDLEPECAEAYLVKLMGELKVQKKEKLKDCSVPFGGRGNYQKIVRFGSKELKAELEGYIRSINERNRLEAERNELARLSGIYNNACALMKSAQTEAQFKKAAETFASVAEFKDSAKLRDLCSEKAEAARKDAIYKVANLVLDDSHKWIGKETGITGVEKSIKAFESIIDWKDSKEKIELCYIKIEEIKKQAKEDAKRSKRYVNAFVAATIAFIVFLIAMIFIIIPNIDYKKAVALMEEGRYQEAIAAFEALNGYKDSYGKIEECNTAILDTAYNEALSLMEKGKTAEAAIAFGKLGDYKDAKEKSFSLWNEIAVRETVSAGFSHTVGLKSDGIVVAVGENDDGQCDVEGWTDIVAVSVGFSHTVGLKSDGTVVAVGSNGSGQCNVSDWTDIVAVSASTRHTVGLKSDGTVVAVGWTYDGQCDVEGWTDIVAVSAGLSYTVGLKSDGTVVATEYTGDNYCGECNVEGWTDIVAVSAGYKHTVGLKFDGTVVAVGENDEGQCDVEDWMDIVAVSAGAYHTVGLKSDGTVVAVGDNDDGRCDVSLWTDIVAISAGGNHTLGLKSDGTVVAAGDNSQGQSWVFPWTDIRLP